MGKGESYIIENFSAAILIEGLGGLFLIFFFLYIYIYTINSLRQQYTLKKFQINTVHTAAGYNDYYRLNDNINSY